MISNQEDKIISEYLESIGPWRDFVVLEVVLLLFIYKLYLSDPIGCAGLILNKLHALLFESICNTGTQ